MLALTHHTRLHQLFWGWSHLLVLVVKIDRKYVLGKYFRQQLLL